MIGGNAQRKRNKEMMEDQFEMNKKTMDYQNEKQLAMWKDTNAPAQRKMYEEAGLNVGLMYGGSGGGGGATVGGGMGSVSGATASDNSANITSNVQTAMQLRLMEAQKRNIDADTENKQAEATFTGGVKTDQAKAGIDNLIQDTRNKEAQNGLIQIQTALTEENYQKAISEVQIMRNNAQISENTITDAVRIIREEAIGKALQNEATKVGIKVDEAQIKKWETELLQGWENLRQGEQKNRIEEFKAEVQAMYPSMGNTWGHIMNNVLLNLETSTGDREWREEQARKVKK